MAVKESRMQVAWEKGTVFHAGRPGAEATIHLDAAKGPSPVDTLITAIATCAAVDVEHILEKRRTPIEAMSIDVHAVRRDAVPARLDTVTITFHIKGDGIDRENAERAIDLSVNKYCSVKDSLASDVVVNWVLDLQ